MTELEERYDIRSAAWILGHSQRTGVPVLPESMRHKVVDDCTTEEALQIVQSGQAAGLKLYPFKSGTQTLARMERYNFHSVVEPPQICYTKAQPRRFT